MSDNNEFINPGRAPETPLKNRPQTFLRFGDYVYGPDEAFIYVPKSTNTVPGEVADARYNIEAPTDCFYPEELVNKEGIDGDEASIRSTTLRGLDITPNDMITEVTRERIETELGMITFTPEESQVIDSRRKLLDLASGADNVDMPREDTLLSSVGNLPAVQRFASTGSLERIQDRIDRRIFVPRREQENDSTPEASLATVSLVALTGLIAARRGGLKNAFSRFGSMGKKEPIPLIHEISPAVEEAGYDYREARLERGGLRADVEQFLGRHPEIMAGVQAVQGRAVDLNKGATAPTELHRNQAPWIAGVMSEPEARREFMRGLQGSAKTESDAIKQKAIRARKRFPETDVLVVGAGPAAAVFTARMRREQPDVSVLSADARQHLGGQFASYGNRPVFEGNSRSDRRQSREFGLPGGDQNLNSFGPYAPMQLTDVVPGSTFTNVDMGHIAAVNQYLSGPTMLGARLVNVAEAKGQYRALFVDEETGRTFPVDVTDKIIMMSGSGERTKSKFGEGVLTAEEVFSHFGNENGMFPMDRFTGKTIAIIGGGDTGRAVARLMAGIAPREAYGKSVTQLGRPECVVWFGTDFRDRDGFCDTSRPIYSPLAPYIARDRGDDSALIFPYPTRVERVRPLKGQNGKQFRIDSFDAQPIVADMVIDATTLESTAEEPFASLDLFDNRYIYATGEELGFATDQRTAIARQLRRGIFVAGAALKPTLTDFETAQFADGIIENTVSLWASAPRVDALARRQVQGTLPGFRR